MIKYKVLFVVSLLSSITMLSACAPVLIGSAAVTGAAVATDRRSVGSVANDNLIETKASLHLGQTELSSSHITTTSYDGNVLLTGEVGTEDDKAKVTEIIKSINEVKEVYNELEVAENASLTTRMNDSITASKIRAALLDDSQVTLTSLKVVVDRGTAYLIGAVTQEEADRIAKIASEVPGVTKVVCLFTILSQDELDKRLLMKNDDSQGSNSSNPENSQGQEENTQVTQ